MNRTICKQAKSMGIYTILIPILLSDRSLQPSRHASRPGSHRPNFAIRLQQKISLWCSWLSRSAVNVPFIYRKVTGSIPVEETHLQFLHV